MCDNRKHQEKIKIVWICHFTNAEIQLKLPIWKKTDEMASWIPNLLKGFENHEEIELHVVAPHEYLKKATRLSIRNIHYHFIPFGIPIWHRHWPGIFLFDIYTNYCYFRKNVRKKINQIRPDLINLIGAENAYYSSAILDLKKEYKALISIQGFISQLNGEIKFSKVEKKKMDVEIDILRSFKYFAGEQDSSTYISKYNSDHSFFKFYFPINEVLAAQTKNKIAKYDCIYFGRLLKIKGVEDFIKVISVLKNTKPDVKACIIGAGDLITLHKQAKALNCENNIDFIGFVRSQKELFDYLKSSKVFLAPPHQERLSSTIREAMYLRVPIVAYATGGIPYINEFDENIYLVETGDYLEMARKTLLLLENEPLSNKLAEKAYNYSIKEYGQKVNCERLISAYHAIIKGNYESN